MVPVVYLADQRDGKVNFAPDLTIRQIIVPDWSRDLSPWPADPVFGRVPFAGKADAFLEKVLAEINAACGSQPVILAGYSLAGLFALYAGTKTDRFTGCICASGSLWYDGFTDYLKENPVQVRAAVISLGVKEKKSRNPKMARVEECTEETVRIMEEYTSVRYIRQPGGHFADIGERVSEDIHALNVMLMTQGII
jgi:predicted alpha/beta superfamily hydrolase